MLAVAIAVLPFVDGKLFRRLLPTIAIGFVLLAGFVVYGQALQGGVDVNQFSDSAQNEGTILWRIDSWKDLVLGEEQTLQSVLIGKSAGSGFHRLDLATGRSIDVAPHNEYITRYLRTGVIGAVCVMFFLIRPIKRLRALGRSDKMAVYPSVASWTISVFMIAVYGVTYGIDAHSFALVGICNALISSREPTLTGADRATSVWSLSMNSGSTIG
jgi:O-antigen ligase